MKWKFIVPIESEGLIYEFEQFSGYQLPDFFKQLVMENNAGKPENWIADTESGNRIMIKKLLSFNKDDKDSIWNVKYPDGLIPFMLDAFGHQICFNKTNGEIIFVGKDKKEFLADNIEDFIERLHK